MNIKRPTEGEVLLLITKRIRKSNTEIAKLLDIHPNHLSKLFKSEKLTKKIKLKAPAAFGVDEAIFSGSNFPSIPGIDFMVNEPEVEYTRETFGDMSAADVLRYLEEKDRRHYEERARLLGIIENLTKNK